MKDAVGLTGLQLSILQILWERGEATSHEVWEALQDERPLAPTTVATLLSRLERKRVIGHRREGRRYVFKPLVSRSEVRRSKVRELTESLFGGDPTALVNHLVRADEVGADDLARMRELIENAEAEEHG